MNRISKNGQASAGDTHYVYIIRCQDQNLYVGCTNNLENRLLRHSKGWVKSTKHRLPFELVTYLVFQDRFIAYRFEKYFVPQKATTYVMAFLRLEGEKSIRRQLLKTEGRWIRYVTILVSSL